MGGTGDLDEYIVDATDGMERDIEMATVGVLHTLPKGNVIHFQVKGEKTLRNKGDDGDSEGGSVETMELDIYLVDSRDGMQREGDALEMNNIPDRVGVYGPCKLEDTTGDGRVMLFASWQRDEYLVNDED